MKRERMLGADTLSADVHNRYECGSEHLERRRLAKVEFLYFRTHHRLLLSQSGVDMIKYIPLADVGVHRKRKVGL